MEIRGEVLKYRHWIKEDIRKTLDAFMSALDEGFKIGISEKGISPFVDHLLNGVIELLDKVSGDISSDKKKNLNASLNNIKRMIETHSWNAENLTLDIAAIEQKISHGEKVTKNMKRERYYMDLHKIDDQVKKQRIEENIQQQKQMILDKRKDLEKIHVSLKTSKHFSLCSYSFKVEICMFLIRTYLSRKMCVS